MQVFTFDADAPAILRSLAEHIKSAAAQDAVYLIAQPILVELV